MVTIPEKEPYIQSLDKSWFEPYAENVAMLRLDIVHPVVSGNKWYKLKENTRHVVENGYKGIITFGGAYSNHLVAAAATAKTFGLPSVGIVRGTYAADSLTETLKSCIDHGMQVEFVSREEYARKTNSDWLARLQARYPGYYIIPEGGANEWGRAGAGEIARYIPGEYTHVCVAMGTGTSFAGICNALSTDAEIYGYAPMKGGRYLRGEIEPHLESHLSNYKVFDDWHFGGFGKWNRELVSFMNDFYRINNIPLDMLYTAKMMSGVHFQLQAGFFPVNARILCVHTGGLQGNVAVEGLLYH